MIHLKTLQEIAIMKEGGQKLRAVIDELLPQIKVGMSTYEIDEIAEKLIAAQGAEPSFKKVQGYHWSTCLPINEQVVHTPPSQRLLIDGDVLTVDIGVFYKGFHTDFATTFIVGEKRDAQIVTFLKVGEDTLAKAIEKVQNGRYLGEVSQVIEQSIKGAGYCILRELTGHGIGRDLHEDPYVLGYLDRPLGKTYKMRLGLVMAIEIIYSVSSEDIDYEEKGKWSVVSKDRSLTACFEKTVAIEEANTSILT